VYEYGGVVKIGWGSGASTRKFGNGEGNSLRMAKI